MSDDIDPNKPRGIRIPHQMWTAYGNICKQLGTNRTADLLAHIRRQINSHGTARDLDLLAQADEEGARRHARISPGRPKNEPDAAE
ncbi:hypothetical protein [Acrocarpospora sp. B8E8]|uniref:hypothetical protein n=1 Tax=Acrocarpospora sp. B8E8 TaxID=3153572 RepID=UPI00325EF54E